MIKIIQSAARVIEDKGKGRLLTGQRMSGRGIEESLYPFFSLCARCRRMVSATSRPFYPRECGRNLIEKKPKVI